jgi:hypothetical protein
LARSIPLLLRPAEKVRARRASVAAAAGVDKVERPPESLVVAAAVSPVVALEAVAAAAAVVVAEAVSRALAVLPAEAPKPSAIACSFR